MKIEVTQEDIDNGGEGGGACPVSLAASRAFGAHVWAARYDLYIDGSTDPAIPLPDEVTEWTRIYDDEGGDNLKPFTFEVETNAKDRKVSKKGRSTKKKD